jgi:hypothetical protein
MGDGDGGLVGDSDGEAGDGEGAAVEDGTDGIAVGRGVVAEAPDPVPHAARRPETRPSTARRAAGGRRSDADRGAFIG